MADGGASVDVALARSVSQWAGDPQSLPPPAFQGMCQQVWERFLRPHVHRKRGILGAALTTSQGHSAAESGISWAGDFLHARVRALPAAARASGFAAPALQRMALQWLWHLCASQDRLGAKVYTALGVAVRALQQSHPGCIVVGDFGRGGSASSSWWRRGMVAGAGVPNRLAADAELRVVLERVVAHETLVRLGRVRLPRLLASTLQQLPAAWRQARLEPAAWPGASLASVLRVVLGIADPARRFQTLSAGVPPHGGAMEQVDVRRDALSLLIEARPSQRMHLRLRFRRDALDRVGRGLQGERLTRCQGLASWWLQRWSALHWDRICAPEHSARDVSGWLLLVASALEELTALPSLKSLAVEFYGQDPARPRPGDLGQAQRADDRQLVSIAIRDTLRQVYR